MAGVILLVAWRLVDFKEIKHILVTSRSETAIALVTFLSALFVDLEFAIYAGVSLSLGLFLNSTAKPYLGVGSPGPKTPQRMFKNAALHGLHECPQMLIARLDGPLYFGSVEFLRRKFREFEVKRNAQKHMLFIAKGTGEIDMSGADLLIEESLRRNKRGGSFSLEIKTPLSLQKQGRTKIMKSLTKDNIYLCKNEAISEIVPRLDAKICSNCTVRIFRECIIQPNNLASYNKD